MSEEVYDQREENYKLEKETEQQRSKAVAYSPQDQLEKDILEDISKLEKLHAHPLISQALPDFGKELRKKFIEFADGTRLAAQNIKENKLL
jgi:hypothetical protein